ncbi:MAG: SPW repeat protein [Pseudonocardia sp.]|nr:SPW repeat protein [Pseudonocardia sp.]
MTSGNPPMAEHPDVVEVKRAHDLELRQRYEHAAEARMGQAADGIILIGGLYIALSPWIMGFGDPLRMNNLIVGLAIAVLGFGFASAYGSTHRLAWVCPVLGAWTIVSFFVINGGAPTMGALLSNVIAGAVVLVCGLAIFGAGESGMAASAMHREGAQR